jgi:glutathione S-transferase
LLKLYDLAGIEDRRFSPTCWRVKMALAHKGLDFETVPTPFTRIAEIGGGVSKTVPVLEHDGRFVAESTLIAHHLEQAFADRPTLFGGPGGAALTEFVDSWVLATLHQQLAPMVVKDIHDHCLPEDRPYFRESRERRFGRTLEDVQADREARVEPFRASLLPLRVTLKRQPFLGGERPLYADYIVLGAFQWTRSTSPFKLLADDDPVRDYLQSLMDLFDGRAGKAVAYPL